MPDEVHVAADDAVDVRGRQTGVGQRGERPPGRPGSGRCGRSLGRSRWCRSRRSRTRPDASVSHAASRQDVERCARRAAARAPWPGTAEAREPVGAPGQRCGPPGHRHATGTKNSRADQVLVVRQVLGRVEHPDRQATTLALGVDVVGASAAGRRPRPSPGRGRSAPVGTRGRSTPDRPGRRRGRSRPSTRPAPARACWSARMNAKYTQPSSAHWKSAGWVGTGWACRQVCRWTSDLAGRTSRGWPARPLTASAVVHGHVDDLTATGLLAFDQGEHQTAVTEARGGLVAPGRRPAGSAGSCGRRTRSCQAARRRPDRRDR